jgi:uncharacterized Tic20 family protein
MNPYAPPPSVTETTSPDHQRVTGEIRRHAIASVVIALVGLVFCGVVLGPLAILRSKKVERLIEQNKVGGPYKATAQAGRFLGYMDLVVFFAYVLGVLLPRLSR